MPAVTLRIDHEGMKCMLALGYKPSVALIHQVIEDPILAVAVACVAARSDEWNQAGLVEADAVGLALALELTEFLPADQAPLVRSGLKLLARARECIETGSKAEERALGDLARMARESEKSQ